MTTLMVVLGAAVGAPARYLIDRAVQSRHESLFPWGTFCANTVGCLLLGVLTVLPLSGEVMALAATGFCGALTTYSTFAYETVRLVREGARTLAVLNAVASITVGLAAASVAVFLAGALFG
ncbi:fluoride efflux transporter CrcB [Nocardiopsis ansamitocini]|uniref:fluoride efflux transporter CrcB n=1 Tax=Nocardiopsis ansamitocini TaxID=1670832 RepID=UPI002556982E|nr:fluoride efflux transporter CrcB [Nocardiopsis ansamitocini]